MQGFQDYSLSEQPQGSSSLEYITLREMLADLVDLLAGNAPVILKPIAKSAAVYLSIPLVNY